MLCSCTALLSPALPHAAAVSAVSCPEQTHNSSPSLSASFPLVGGSHAAHDIAERKRRQAERSALESIPQHEAVRRGSIAARSLVWSVCGVCHRSSARLLLPVPSCVSLLPPVPAMSAPSSAAAPSSSSTLLPRLALLLRDLIADLDSAYLVSQTSNAPGDAARINHSMDLRKVQAKYESGAYPSIGRMAADILLTFDSAVEPRECPVGGRVGSVPQ